MAPQNSTLIQYAESTPELVTNYSPILPPRLVHSDQSHRTSDAESESLRSVFTDHEDQWRLHQNDSEEDEVNAVEEELPIWIGKDDVRYVSGVTSATTCNDVIAVLIQDELNTKSYSNIEGLKQDVDDYIIVEKWRDVEAKLDGETKILPLFQAWGTLQDVEVRFKLKINKNKNIERIEAKIEKKVVKKDKMNVVTKMIKRVLKQGDYIQKHINVLKEKRDRHPNKPNNSKNVFNKKLFYETCRPNNSTQSLASSKCSSVERLYCKCCHNLTIKNKGFEVSKLTYTNNLQPLEDAKTDDELLLVLDNPDTALADSNETLKADSGHASGHSFSFHSECNLNDLIESMNVDDTPYKSPVKKNLIRTKSYLKSMNNSDDSLERLDSDPIRATPKRNLRSLKAYDILRQHSLNRKLFESLSHLNISEIPSSSSSSSLGRPPRSDQFDSIRYEIMIKMSEMKQLLLREEMLLTQIQLKCAHYKAENEIYNLRVEPDLRVDEIQKNLEECAREIIQNEQELFKTKLEVERKEQVLQELKDLLQVEHPEEDERIRFKERSKKQLERVRDRMSLDELHFVDDIYEFCDGNKSLIV